MKLFVQSDNKHGCIGVHGSTVFGVNWFLYIKYCMEEIAAI